MLLISTDHDPATSVLARCAATLSTAFGGRLRLHLNGPAAVAATIQRELQGKTEAVFFFGHGDDVPPRLRDNLNQTAVGSNHSNLFASRVLCAAACHAANSFARGLPPSATTVGFDSYLNIPLSPSYFAEFETSVLAAPNALLQGMDCTAAVGVGRQSFQGMAQRLFQRNQGNDQWTAAAMNINRMRLRLVGVGSATI